MQQLAKIAKNYIFCPSSKSTFSQDPGLLEVASEDVLDTMIDEVILGFCFDIHRLLSWWLVMNQKINTHFSDLSKLEPGRFHSWQGKRNRPCLLLAMLMWGNNSILSLLLSNSFVCLNISSVLKNYIRFVGIWIACVYYNWVALPENNSPGSAIIVFHIWHICRISYQYNIS